jgi:MFS transporter, AAHS family, 4-hydroxybenzoate transporter
MTVEQWLGSRRVGGFQIFVTVLCGLAVFLDGISTQLIAYLAPAIHNALHLDHKQMGAAFAAGMVGLLVGGLICSVLADVFGRRRVLIVSTLIFGVFTLVTGTATSGTELLAWRLIAGLGLGGAMPIAITLTAEIAPGHARSVMVMAMFCGFPLGSAIAGLLASAIMPSYGWSAVFYVAGAISLVVAAVLIVALPESLVFLVEHDADPGRIAAAQRRIDPAPGEIRFARNETKKMPVAGLFREGRSAGTLIMWVIYFCSLLEIYFLASWLPTVLNQGGRSLANAALGTSMLQFGGVAGTLVFGQFMDRLNPHRILLVGYLAACVFIGMIGYLYKSAIILPILFLAGMCLIGCQSGLSAVASVFYPTGARATGIGWNLSIGRLGSVTGPLIGAVLLSSNVGVESMFMWIALPTLLAGVLALVLKYVTPKSS